MSNAKSQPSAPASIFQGKFTLDKLLGKGGFGEVWQGTQVSTGERVALKLERNSGRSFLFHEARVMQDLQTFSPGAPAAGLPTLKYFGQEGDYRVLIMTIHGPSLEDLHEHLGKFSLKTTAMLADQMISRLEYVHSVGYVHRDLKPDNFLMGIGKLSHHVYLIDYGLSTKFTSTTTGQHREITSGRNFVGTTRYASLRTHQGFSQSRRDDMEQLAYILIYLYRGRLPWSGLQVKDRDEKERAIGELKEKLPTPKICDRCPRQFEDLLLYSRKMEFEEQPQYEMCRMLMASVLDELGPTLGKNDFEYDWVTKKQPAATATTQPSSTTNKPHPPTSPRSPVVSGGAPAQGGVLSSAQGRGVFSGIGSQGVGSQDITSLGGFD